MRDGQSRALNAAVAGQSYMDVPANQSIWNGKAAVVSKKAELDACIIKIGQIDDAINDMGGIATTKRGAREAAAKTAWMVANALVAFAEDMNDNVLKEEIDFSLTDLRQVKDATAIDRWRLVYNRAQTYIGALTAGGYGVDAGLQTTFLNQRNAFESWRGKPRAAIADTKALNIDLKNEFEKLDRIVESLKTRLVQFATTNLTFYNGATAAFEIDMTGIRHQALVIQYEDADTGIRLARVKSRIVEKQIVKTATKHGLVRHRQQELPQGNYSVESVLDTYHPDSRGNIAVEKGKLMRLVIKLKKI